MLVLLSACVTSRTVTSVDGLEVVTLRRDYANVHAVGLPDGGLLLESDNLARRPTQDHGSSETAARWATMAGQTHTELKTGDGVIRPLVYSEAYVPFHDARGHVLGVVEVFVDQAERAAALERERHAAIL